MANESYVRNSTSAIENDLKIFTGTKAEIMALKAQLKLVPNKWYLAWDRGEIFVTSPNKKLIQYGGSNALTQEEIEEIIANYTESDLNMIKTQLSTITKSYGSYKSEFVILQNTINSKINELETKTTDLITSKVNQVLSDASSITYSKDQIDSKIANAIATDNARDDNKYATKTSLDGYVKTETLAGALSTKLEYASGNSIADIIATKKVGMYFAITDSTDEKYLKGHIYYSNGSSYEDLTPEGSGSGGSYVPPSLVLTIDGYSSIQLKIGESFTGSKSFKFNISNPDNISGILSFFEPNNSTAIKTVAPSVTTATDFIANLNYLNVGTYKYTLSGQDKKGNNIIGNYTISVVAPTYYGSYGVNAPNSTIIKSQFSARNLSDVAGKYTVSVANDEYIWICVPELKSISSFTLNGFMAPFEAPVQVKLTFNGVENTYNCYRSSAALEAGVITVNAIS